MYNTECESLVCLHWLLKCCCQSSGTANKNFYKCENSKPLQPLHIFNACLKLRSFLITPSTSAHLWVLKHCFLIWGRLHTSDTSQHPQLRRSAAPHRHHTQCQWCIASSYWAAGWKTGIFSKWSRRCPLLPLLTIQCPSLHLGWLHRVVESPTSLMETISRSQAVLYGKPNISSWNLLILCISSGIFPHQATFCRVTIPRVTFTQRSTHIGPDPVGHPHELWDHMKEDPCWLSRLCPPNCSPLCPNSHTWFQRWAFRRTTFTLGPVCLGCP